MKHAFTFAIFLLVTNFVIAADLDPSPTSLNFGTVNKGAAKTVPFTLKNTTGHKMDAEMTVSGSFTVSPAKASLNEGQQITVSVTLPATVAAGAQSGTVTIKGSRLGLLPRLQGQVTLAATVVIQPDFSIVAKDNGNSVVGVTRTLGIHLVCTSAAGTATMKTQVFVTFDNGPEQKQMDIVFVYSPTGQINGFGTQFSTSIHTVKIRAVTDPDNTVAESSETNNQSILTLTY
jgi:CARDB